MSKSEKSAYFRHVFANNFFWCICVFWYPYWIFNKKIFSLISTFCKLWLQMRRKRLKKTENLFLWMCLRILLGNHQRVCITKLLKSLYPTVQPLLLGVQHPQLAVHCTASPAFRQISTDVVHFLLLSACSGGVYSLQITTVVQYFWGVLFLLYFASWFLDSYDLLDLRFGWLPICRVNFGFPSHDSQNK